MRATGCAVVQNEQQNTKQEEQEILMRDASLNRVGIVCDDHGHPFPFKIQRNKSGQDKMTIS